MLNKDQAEKERRGYKHPKSKVFDDGREILHGKDWERRKLELWDRAGGRCEFVDTTHPAKAEWRCLADSGDPCHVIPRYPVRDDRLTNLKFYCRFHHQLTEKQSWRKIHSAAMGKEQANG